LALSHDGKKLLYTRNDSKMGSERTIVLFDFDTARSKDLVHGTVREAFWAPDDTRLAYLQSQEQKWRVVSSPIGAPGSATPLYNGDVDSLQGWADGHTVLANDPQSLYWVSDDRPQQSVPLKEIYGDTFRVSDSDTIRINPINPDLLLVSAKYFTAPPGAAADADAAGIFLYEIHAKRRVTLTPPEQWSSHGEWSRDGIQIFYTRRMSATSSVTYRIFWDGSGPRRYVDGTDLVIGQ
jgi:Tol biopolymer transport system component